MEVNIKNKKYNYVEKGIIKLNDVSPSFINIGRKESMGINIYYIDHFYLNDDDNGIELKPFYFVINNVYGYFEENNGGKNLILIILIIIKRFCKNICFYGMILKI